ncbi:NAD(P)-dependent oxidoreductase [Arthrobacter sulfonylureivorans]|uniref:NAD(P)H-binding protein n=1 Tax=Arthrobacter sulfonylureivorans TaxID=2486855 RepID=A0ABY3W9T5_9MICC|nr:NAD(P)H-binding protein [Arthrobacter sulfonylureivorans]UNK47113.1 NAD(P)H-binding protein [Arthrobacter sulfonylureivorans]
MTNVAVIGAAGKAGRAIVSEGLHRGFKMKSLVRNPERSDVLSDSDFCDAAQGDTVASAVSGADVVVVAISPVPGDEKSLANAVEEVLTGADKAGVSRMIMVGGAGTLQIHSGALLMESEAFPEAALPTATAHRFALDALRASATDVDWVYISPAAVFLPEGPMTGEYQVGDDMLLLDSEGKSQISYQDFARALMDEVENPKHHRTRFTVAWA